MATDIEFGKKRPIIHKDANGNFTLSNLQSTNYYRVVIEADGQLVGSLNVKHIQDIRPLLSTWKLVNSMCISNLPTYRFIVNRSNSSHEFEIDLEEDI